MLDKQKLRTFVLGGLTGVLAGILFAPKSGRELRGSISSQAGEARERGRETYFDAQERMRERVAEARERSPRPAGTDLVEEEAVDPLPKLGPAAPEPGFEPLVDPALAGAPADTPPLRDVSRGATQPVSSPAENTEEMRRRIQETRSRLRARLEDSRRDLNE
ncbi:hypothetical protein BH24ACT19_BH24ACT19_05540 [soil metagenome]|jgi:hypothetical protein